MPNFKTTSYHNFEPLFGWRLNWFSNKVNCVHTFFLGSLNLLYKNQLFRIIIEILTIIGRLHGHSLAQSTLLPTAIDDIFEVFERSLDCSIILVLSILFTTTWTDQLNSHLKDLSSDNFIAK